MANQVQHLHYDIEVMTRRLELEKRRLHRLEKELATAKRTRRIKVSQQAASSGCSNRGASAGPPPLRNEKSGATGPRSIHTGPDIPAPVKKEASLVKKEETIRPESASKSGPSAPARVLMNRLDVHKKQLNTLKSENVTLQQDVDGLRRARLQCNDIFQKLRLEINDKSSLLADFVDETAASQAVHSDVKQRLAVMKGQREAERNEFKAQVMRMRDQLKTHALEKKEVEVQLKRAETGVQKKRELIVPEEETQFNETAMMRRIVRTAFLNCIQRRHIKQHEKNIEVFETAFATIKQSTGIEHIEEIVKIFVNLETNNYSLLVYVNHMNHDIEALEGLQRERRNLEMERLKSAEMSAQQRELALADLERKLKSTEQAINEHRDAISRRSRVLEDARGFLVHIVDRIESETGRLKSVGPADSAGLKRPQGEPAKDTMPEWLEWVEVALGKFKDLLPGADREASFPSSAAVAVKQLVPKRLGGHGPPLPLVKAQELPSLMCLVADENTQVKTSKVKQAELLDEESEEEDFGERPLRHQELRDRAIHSAVRRKKRGQDTRGGGARSAKDRLLEELNDPKDANSEGRVRQHGSPPGSPSQRMQLGQSSFEGAGGPETAVAAVASSSPVAATGSSSATEEAAADNEAAVSRQVSKRSAEEPGASEDTQQGSAEQEQLSNAASGTLSKKQTPMAVALGGRAAAQHVSDKQLQHLFLDRFKMTKEELQLMADRQNISLADFCNLKAEFDKFDEEKTGYVDIRELNTLMHTLGHDLHERKLDEATRALDVMGNNEFDFFEFVEWYSANNFVGRGKAAE